MATANGPGNSSRTNVNEKTDHLTVAAIDFGTTFTGFAFSFSDGTIFTSTWSGENVRTSTEKAPTCLLLSPEKEFVAFGYEAEEQYKTLIEDDRAGEIKGDDTGRKAKEYYYFEKFKMKLYQTKKLRLDTKLADTHGKELPAIDIFAAVISYLKDKIISEVQDKYAGFQDDDILWVITVPAIWSDSAKQFMKEAARKAGLESNIKLILEPEAASLYCNNENLCKIAKLDGSNNLEPFPEGQKYIVADLGGGTVDLSVHEILPDRNLREIRRADGDALGGVNVDLQYFDFLEQIFGTKVIQSLRDNYPDFVFDIQQPFETKKIKFDPEKPELIRIKIPKPQLKEIISELGDESLEAKIDNASEIYGKENLKLVADKLCIGKNIMQSFFTKATDGIVSFINKMREDDELGEINILLLVGGFSESKYVQSVIRCNVPGVRVIIPPGPSLAVLKGAVIAGRNPKAITERIARFTYGFSFAKKFVPGEHPEKFKVTQNGVELCSSIFVKVITKGDILRVGDHFGVPCAHFSSHDVVDMFSLLMRCMPLVADVYKSDEKDPKYADEEYGCERIGLMLIPPPLSGWPPTSLIYQELVVGEAEFTVRAVNFNTMEVFAGKLDFLSCLSEESSLLENPTS